MQQVPLQQLPNQSFTIQLDGNTWDFTIKATNGVMSVSLVLNQDDLMDNIRAVAGTLIIPADYQESGNFFFLTANEQLPDYTLFNVNQYLIYLSPADLAANRPVIVPPITAADFNPLAPLPLRFSPQGYTQA